MECVVLPPGYSKAADAAARMCHSRFERDNIMEATAVTDQPIEPAGRKDDEDNMYNMTVRPSRSDHAII